MSWLSFRQFERPRDQFTVFIARQLFPVLVGGARLGRELIGPPSERDGRLASPRLLRGVRAFGLSLGERRLDLGVSLELERGAGLSRAVHPFLSSFCQRGGGGSSSGARFSHRVRDPIGPLGTLVSTLAVGEVSGHRWVRSFRGVSSPAVSIGA